MPQSSPLLVPTTAECAELEKRIAAGLALRLSGPDMSTDEIVKVSGRDKALFPKGFAIPAETMETFRLLCTWSRCQLRPAREIRSHRRFIGPVIVFLKRLSWPFIQFHLKDTFESMELFHSRLIYAYAAQVVETEQLKNKLRSLP